VYAWGQGKHGALGVGNKTGHPSPVRVESLCGRGVRHVYAGHAMNGALLGPWYVFVWVAVSFVVVSFAGDGRVFTWGWNDDGQLGLGDTNNRLTPTAVSLPDDEAVEELHCGLHHFFARVGEFVCMFVCVARVTYVCDGSASGAWFAWGYNIYGQLALGNTTRRTVPTRVESVSSLGVASLSCGAYYVLALTSAYVVCV
jgi:alpha-tubulin suppressor-like RCC1 family protein